MAASTPWKLANSRKQGSPSPPATHQTLQELFNQHITSQNRHELEKKLTVSADSDPYVLPPTWAISVPSPFEKQVTSFFDKKHLKFAISDLRISPPYLSQDNSRRGSQAASVETCALLCEGVRGAEGDPSTLCTRIRSSSCM